ncbi:MAG: hypothetical protein WED04_08440 [Promethearchaeati archaeon SRVP18_Atabeyarchaeia-1]
MSYVENAMKWCDDKFGGRGEVSYDQVLAGSKGEKHKIDVVVKGKAKSIPVKYKLLRLTETRHAYNNEVTFVKIVDGVCHLKDFDLFAKTCEDFGDGLMAKLDPSSDGEHLFPSSAIIMAKDGFDSDLLTDWWLQKETNLKLDYGAGKLYLFSKYVDVWVRTAKPDACKCFLELWTWNNGNPVQVLPFMDERGRERLNFKEARNIGLPKVSEYARREDKAIAGSEGLNMLDELLGVYVFMQEGSCVFDHKFRGMKGDASLLTGALTAISSIIKETTRSEGGLRFVDHGDVKLIFTEEPNIIAALVSTQYRQLFRVKLERFAQAFYDTFKEEIDNWKGNLKAFNGAHDFIKDIFEV